MGKADLLKRTPANLHRPSLCVCQALGQVWELAGQSLAFCPLATSRGRCDLLCRLTLPLWPAFGPACEGRGGWRCPHRGPRVALGGSSKGGAWLPRQLRRGSVRATLRHLWLSGPGSLRRFISECAACPPRPPWPKHELIFIECKSHHRNLFPCLAVTPPTFYIPDL